MNFYYSNPDGRANHTGSNTGALYKAMTKPTKVKITANDRKAWSCIRNFKHTYLVNSSISTSDLWNFRFYSPSSKDNDLQTPGWNLSCVYFHICGSKSIWINFFLNTGCMPK